MAYYLYINILKTVFLMFVLAFIYIYIYIYTEDVSIYMGPMHNSTVNNVVFIFVSDLKIVFYNNY